ncbi:MAG: glutamine--fructose-6-phosphate transaminase (isomerizing) [Candidatus Dependentiae bacterium]|nr:glutamine--fructose-6-phosphate transaminase (isomerizing) [Candidatus Dependentiae bacterium]
MCSVFGYIGKQYSRQLVMEGLSRLEYRGYDSAGFACLDPQSNHIVYSKSSGALKELRDKLDQKPIDGHVSIGHTRWATHGDFSVENAHPHFDCEKNIALIHNGIIENHQELRDELVRSGHLFHSKTDTEVAAHLFEQEIETRGLSAQLCSEIFSRLHGAYAFVVILKEYADTMIIARKRSPLCVGVGNDELFVSSDPLAFADKTKNVLFMPDESFALLSAGQIALYSFDGKPLPVTISPISFSLEKHDKLQHKHFMLKEIYEQKTAIKDTLLHMQKLSGDLLWQQLGLTVDQAKNIDTMSLIGCGTSWYAGRIAQFFFEQIARIQTQVTIASEFRYMPFFARKEALYLAITQSGETADTLEALRLVHAYGGHSIGLTNVASSTVVRETRGSLITQAGCEVAVASTKAFVTQLTALYWLAHRFAEHKGLITSAEVEQAENNLLAAAEVLEACIENNKLRIMQELAPYYATYQHYIFLGRHISYPLAMEAALKLKEITYIFAQAYPAGELKHGPLALIDAQVPVVVFSHQDPIIYHKLVSNAQEVKARNGHIIAFAFEGQHELIALSDTVFTIPRVAPLLEPLAMIGLMQFFVYQMALVLDRPIDKPRNLAKSVTVE